MAPTTAQKERDWPESHLGVRQTLLDQVTATETSDSDSLKPHHCKIQWNCISSSELRFARVPLQVLSCPLKG